MIPKTSEPYFLPDLFYGVHFRRIWRNEEQADIISAVFHTAQMPSMCSILRHSTVETLTAIRELKACDVNIIFESENIDTLAVDSEVLITIISAYAQAENDSRSDNVTWGIKKRAADGTSGLYRRRCYGYTNDESGELAIVPAEAEVVHFIFESYLNGASLMKIRTALEERGTLSPTGKSKWCNRTIDMMLSNEKYCGEVILIKMISHNSVMRKRIANTGQRESYKMIESHPPIITRDEFDRAQAEKAKRQRNKTSKGE